MKSSTKLAFGFALCLGLVGCGPSRGHDPAQPAEREVAAAAVPVEQIADLREASSQMIGEISKVQAEIQATRDVMDARPEEAASLSMQLGELEAKLKELKAEYAKAQDQLSDAEGFELLLRFIVDHQVTSLDRLPAVFEEARADAEAHLAQIQGEEQGFITRVESSVGRVTEARVAMKAMERSLLEKIVALKQKPNITPEEQQQLEAIQSFLDSGRQLAEVRAQLSKAYSELREHQETMAVAQKKRTELATQKTNLIRQLLDVPADDEARREQIMQRIERVQGQILDIDVEIHGHETIIASSQTLVAEHEAAVQSLSYSIETLAPGLAPVAGTDLSASMKQLADAERELQALQTEYQAWRVSVLEAELSLARISRLEAFFAQKYPDIRPTQPGQPVQPQS